MNKNHKKPFDWSYRFQQLIILILHLLLLYWILYTLREGGIMPIENVMLHFVGMSLYGALLIRSTAWWARHHFVKEVTKKRRSS